MRTGDTESSYTTGAKLRSSSVTVTLQILKTDRLWVLVLNIKCRPALRWRLILSGQFSCSIILFNARKVFFKEGLSITTLCLGIPYTPPPPNSSLCLNTSGTWNLLLDANQAARLTAFPDFWPRRLTFGLEGMRGRGGQEQRAKRYTRCLPDPQGL